MYISDPHGHNIGSHGAHGPEGEPAEPAEKKDIASAGDNESMNSVGPMDDNALAQIVGVAILEFGVALHR